LNPDQDLETVAFEGLDGVEGQLDAWQRLMESARADALFNGPTWVMAHVRAFAPETSLFGWTIYRGGEPMALFAFRIEESRGTFALRRGQAAADGSFDSDYCEPLIRPGFEEAAARALLDRLAEQRRVEALVLTGLRSDFPFLKSLHDELVSRGQPMRVRESTCLALELPASFDGYLEHLKPRMRTKVRSAIRQAEENGARATLCSEPDELGPYLDELFLLHGRRWRTAGQPGSFEDSRRRVFYRSMASEFLRQGALRLTRLVKGTQALASQLGIVLNGTYYQLQEGYDPEFSHQRVGVALRGLAIRGLIDEGVGRYDFLAGDSTHKRDWGGTPEPCTTLAFGVPRWRARWSYGMRALVDRLRPRQSSIR
jgi:CelD/BcsL family acetyltransferase involved in cellulose biosynthesis